MSAQGFAAELVEDQAWGNPGRQTRHTGGGQMANCLMAASRPATPWCLVAARMRLVPEGRGLKAACSLGSPR